VASCGTSHQHLKSNRFVWAGFMVTRRNFVAATPSAAECAILTRFDLARFVGAGMNTLGKQQCDLIAGAAY
jgi:hypothetical protein